MKLKDNSAGRDRLNNKIRVVSVVGPTASGKTKLSVALAKHFDGEIISADSMQIYRGMTVATAKPTREEQEGIPHHLMDFLPATESYSVAKFAEDARRCIADVSGRGRLPFIVGGTGLYVDALLNNVQFMDAQRDDALTKRLHAQYEQSGIEPLLAELAGFDPQSAQRLSAERNPKRVIRAIEFYRTCGVTITEQAQRSRLEEPPYQAVKLALNFRDREKLYERINLRVDLMMQQGLLQEAQEVLGSPRSSTSAMAIGYKELAPYFRGEAALADCVEKLKRETRRYAKRQLTWFRRDKDIHWLYPDDYSSFEELYDAAVQIINKGLLYG